MLIMFKMHNHRSIFINIFVIYFVFLKYTNAQGGNGNGNGNGNGLYSRRYEKLDVDTILANPRLVTNYVDCLLNKRPCPPEGKDLKRILPEALRTKCGRCWPSQKEGALKVITKLYYDYPQHYSALRQKWDPTGEYHRRFEEYLRDQNFNLISRDDADEQVSLQPLPITITPTSTISTTTPTPTSIPLTTSQAEVTQRTTRQDAIDTQDVFLANRIGVDQNEFEDKTRKEQPQRTPAPTPPPKSPARMTTPCSAQNTYSSPYGGGTATFTIFKTQNPFLNFLNRLTTKFATTAEIIAGMIRGNGRQTNQNYNKNYNYNFKV